jgi:ribonuclease Z
MYFAFLGTSAALPSVRRDTTALVFVGREEAVLVDCGGSPLQKLLLAAVDPADLVRVVITHIHPDHAYGLPALVQNLHLLERRAPLHVSCREEHAAPLRALLELFGLLDRPGIFPVVFEPVAARAGTRVATTASFEITATPNAHGTMPNLALRFDRRDRRGAVVYSSDTEPCAAVAALAAGADTLIHEATFRGRDGGRVAAHSTAGEAGAIAAQAGVGRLILTHVDPAHHDELDALVHEARAHFAGPVEVGEEFVPYPL